jgi:hypothetical protein
MKAELICMIEKFPNLKGRIQSLFEESEEFQALCYDYLFCLKSLDQWTITMMKDEEVVKEYTELKSMLESELLDYMK